MKLPSLFSDNMVLQRDKPIRVWGEGKGTVSVAFKNQIQSTNCENGVWNITLDKEKAGGPFELKISDDIDEIILRNVMLGDVWLAAGQSNMECITYLTENGNQDSEVLGNNDRIRFYTVPRRTRKDEEVYRWHFESVLSSDREWEVCTPERAKHFSAIGFWCASMLETEENVPVGIISCNFGGTCIESWIEYDRILNDSTLEYAKEKYSSVSESINYNEYLEEHLKNLNHKKFFCRKYNAFELVDNLGLKKFATNPELPWPEDTQMGPYSENFGGVLFENMIKPILPFSLAGVLWYQGESNIGDYNHYFDAFSAMVQNWREAFMDCLPFFTVQIAPFDNYQIADCRPKLNEAQIKASRELEDVYLVSTEDLGEPNNIHPIKKKQVARRLVNAIQSKLNGKNKEYCGPVVKDFIFNDNKLLVSFDHVQNGLKSNQSIKDVFVIDSDGNEIEAYAFTYKDKMIIDLKNVAKPIGVKMGYRNFSNIDLCNNDGITALPFYIKL